MRPTLEKVKGNPAIYRATYPSGRKLYKAVVSFKRGDGSYGQEWRSFATLKTAQVWRRTMLQGIDAGKRPGGDRSTVEDFLERWLAAREPELRKLSVVKYRGLIEKYIVRTSAGSSSGRSMTSHLSGSTRSCQPRACGAQCTRSCQVPLPSPCERRSSGRTPAR